MSGITTQISLYLKRRRRRRVYDMSERAVRPAKFRSITLGDRKNYIPTYLHDYTPQRMRMTVLLFVPSILHPLNSPDAFCASCGGGGNDSTKAGWRKGLRKGRRGGEKKTKLVRAGTDNNGKGEALRRRRGVNERKGGAWRLVGAGGTDVKTRPRKTTRDRNEDAT